MIALNVKEDQSEIVHYDYEDYPIYMRKAFGNGAGRVHRNIESRTVRVSWYNVTIQYLPISIVNLPTSRRFTLKCGRC